MNSDIIWAVKYPVQKFVKKRIFQYLLLFLREDLRSILQANKNRDTTYFEVNQP